MTRGPSRPRRRDETAGPRLFIGKGDRVRLHRLLEPDLDFHNMGAPDVPDLRLTTAASQDQKPADEVHRLTQRRRRPGLGGARMPRPPSDLVHGVTRFRRGMLLAGRQTHAGAVRHAGRGAGRTIASRPCGWESEPSRAFPRASLPSPGRSSARSTARDVPEKLLRELRRKPAPRQGRRSQRRGVERARGGVVRGLRGACTTGLWEGREELTGLL